MACWAIPTWQSCVCGTGPRLWRHRVLATRDWRARRRDWCANLGIAVEVYHGWWDTTLHATLANAHGKVLGYHLCDWLETTSDMLPDRGMMGDGVADLKSIRKAVEDSGYTGPFEVEVFSANNWWQRDPNEVLDVAGECFTSVR